VVVVSCTEPKPLKVTTLRCGWKPKVSQKSYWWFWSTVRKWRVPRSDQRDASCWSSRAAVKSMSVSLNVSRVPRKAVRPPATGTSVPSSNVGSGVPVS
jgi:hypothetical protein